MDVLLLCLRLYALSKWRPDLLGQQLTPFVILNLSICFGLVHFMIRGSPRSILYGALSGSCVGSLAIGPTSGQVGLTKLPLTPFVHRPCLLFYPYIHVIKIVSLLQGVWAMSVFISPFITIPSQYTTKRLVFAFRNL